MLNDTAYQLEKQSPGRSNPITNAAISVGLSRAFHNKDFKAGFSTPAFGNSFIPTEINLENLFEHISRGGAWTPGYFADISRTNATWRRSELIVLDLDNNVSVADCLAVPFIRQNAVIIHPSASSTEACHKTRVIFRLSEAIDGDFHRWRTLAAGIMRHVGLDVDPASIKPAQLYYGSTNQIEQPYINLEAVLPIEYAGALTVDDAIDDMLGAFYRRENPRLPIDAGDNRAVAYAKAAYESALSEASSAGAGQRNETLFKIAVGLFGMARGGWPGIHDAAIINDLRQIVSGWPNKSKSFKTIESAQQRAEPRALELPPLVKKSAQADKVPIAQRVKDSRLSPFTADLSVNMRYISTIDPREFAHVSAVNIKSPMGTGKTQLAAVEMAHLERCKKRPIRVLAISFRAALVDDMAGRLGLMSYSEFSSDLGVSITSAPQVATTLDSLHRLADAPPFDLIIIDEIGKVHTHLESDTMRGGENKRAYAVLKHLVTNAGKVMGFDAQNTDVATAWLGQLTDGAVMSIENTYVPHEGETLTLFSNKEQAVDAAVVSIAAGQGPTWVASSSKIIGETTFAYLQAVMPDKVGILINSDNSCSQDMQRFITHINDELPKLDYLVTSPSLSTGVDVTYPVNTVIGIFPNQPLAADEMAQAMHRCRNAKTRMVWIQPANGTLETDWRNLYLRYDHNRARTAEIAEFEAHDIPVEDTELRGMNRLSSEYRAQRNRQMNDPLSHFVALMRADGYTLAYVDGENKATRAALAAIRIDMRERKKQMTITSPAITHSQFDTLRRKGAVTPEIRAGHARHTIEDTVGLEISDTLYDRLHASQSRAEIRRYADLLDTEANLKGFDRQEGAKGVLYSKRGNRTATRRFIERFILATFGCALSVMPDVLKDMPAADIGERAEQFALDNRQELIDLLGWRPTAHSSNGLPLARYILKSIGLTLSYRRVREGERLFYLYSLDMDVWAETERLARSRLVHMAKQRESALVPNPAYRGMYSYQDLEQPHKSTIGESDWIPLPAQEWFGELDFEVTR